MALTKSKTTLQNAKSFITEIEQHELLYNADISSLKTAGDISSNCNAPTSSVLTFADLMPPYFPFF